MSTRPGRWLSLKAFFKTLHRHQFFTLSGGVALANIVSLVAVPLLAKLYPVEAFGYFAIYSAVSNLIGMFAGLRFEIAISIAKTDEEAHELASLALLMMFLVTAMSLAVLKFFLISFVHVTPEIFWVTGFSIILIGLTQSLTLLNLRDGKVRHIAFKQVLDRVIVLASSLLFYRLGMSQTGLVLAQSLGLLGGVFVLSFGCRWRGLELFSLNAKRVRELFVRYIDYPLKNMGATIFQILSIHVPPILFSSRFSPQDLGNFNIAQRLLDAPHSFVTMSVHPIYYRRLLGERPSTILRLMKRMLLITVPSATAVAIGIILFSRPMTEYFLGQKWALTAGFISALVPLVTSRFLYVLQQNTLVVTRQLGLDMAISGLAVAAQFIGIAYGLFFKQDIYQSILWGSVLAAPVYLGGQWMAYKRIQYLSHSQPH